MKLIRFVHVLLIVLVFSVASFGAEDGFRGKVGFDIKGFKSNFRQDMGWLVGGRWAGYFGTSQVYMGLAAYFGAPTGLSITNEKMYYGGAILGVDANLSKSTVFEANLLLGYGEGQMNQLNISERSHYVVEPGFGLGFNLGGGWRLTFGGSYLHMANAKNFSGPTFGFRFQFRSTAARKPASD
ncbi:MAG: hypothetical protein ACKOA8_14575 [Deltaproteobacteria bacterium]|jgi:hypothetical protein